MTIIEQRHRQATAAIKDYNGTPAPLNGNKGHVSQGAIDLPNDKWNFKNEKTKTIRLTDKRATPAKLSVKASAKVSVKASVKKSVKASGPASVKKVATVNKIKKSVVKKSVSKSAVGSKRKATISGRATTDKPTRAQYMKILASVATSKKNKLSRKI